MTRDVILRVQWKIKWNLKNEEYYGNGKYKELGRDGEMGTSGSDGKYKEMSLEWKIMSLIQYTKRVVSHSFPY